MLKSQPPVVRLVVVINSGLCLLPALSHKVDALINTFGQISPERIAATGITCGLYRLRWKERLPVNLVFICLPIIPVAAIYGTGVVTGRSHLLWFNKYQNLLRWHGG